MRVELTTSDFLASRHDCGVLDTRPPLYRLSYSGLHFLPMGFLELFDQPKIFLYLVQAQKFYPGLAQPETLKFLSGLEVGFNDI